MTKIKAIIFDLDNTLVDFYNFKLKATRSALDAMIENGLKVTNKKADFDKLFSMYYTHGFEHREIFQKFLLQKTFQVDHRILGPAIVAYRKSRDLELKAYPETKETLRKLREHVKLVLVTDAPMLKAFIRLSYIGLQKEFYMVITLDETKKPKISGIPFRLAMEKLKMKPEQIMVVGDSGSRDIMPAKRLGMKTCFALYGRKIKPLVESDYKIDNIGNLLNIIDEKSL